MSRRIRKEMAAFSFSGCGRPYAGPCETGLFRCAACSSASMYRHMKGSSAKGEPSETPFVLTKTVRTGISLCSSAPAYPLYHIPECNRMRGLLRQAVPLHANIAPRRIRSNKLAAPDADASLKALAAYLRRNLAPLHARTRPAPARAGARGAEHERSSEKSPGDSMTYVVFHCKEPQPRAEQEMRSAVES